MGASTAKWEYVFTPLGVKIGCRERDLGSGGVYHSLLRKVALQGAPRGRKAKAVWGLCGLPPKKTTISTSLQFSVMSDTGTSVQEKASLLLPLFERRDLRRVPETFCNVKVNFLALPEQEKFLLRYGLV